MAFMNDKYLTGKFLVSALKADDDCFSRSVIYVCSHGLEGAMGFVVNKKLKDFSFSDLAVPLPVGRFTNLENMFLYQGGPLEKIRGFVLHSSEYNKPGTYQVNDQISISSSLDVLTDIAYGTGPVENLVALGYCAWEPKQLEQEILRNQWFVIDGSSELLFHTEDALKWDRAMAETGLDLERFVFATGHA